MKQIYTYLMMGVLAVGHIASAQWVHETEGELAVAGDWNSDGMEDLLVVDRASGLLRAGNQQSGGAFLWSEPQAAGPENVTAIGFGTFFASSAPTLAVTSPALNRLNLVRYGVASPEPWFVEGIGPRALALTFGGPNGLGGDLFVASSDNGSPSSHRLENWKFPQQIAGTNVALARGQSVGGVGSIAFLARAADAGGTADALFFYPNGNLTLPTVAGDLPLGVDWTWGEFGATTQSFLFWKSGSDILTLRPMNPTVAPFVFDAAVNFTMSDPIYSVTVLTGSTSKRLLIVFNGGASAGVYSFDGTSAPVLVQSFTPTVGQDFRTALPLWGGDFALFSGPTGSTTSTTTQRHRLQSGGDYLADAPSVMSPLPASGTSRSNVLLFTSEPFVSPTAEIFSSLRARDWSVNVNGLPGSLNVLAEIFLGSQSGLGGRQTVPLGSVSGSTQAYALTNQYADDLSIMALAPPSGDQYLSVSLTPPPGTYDEALTVIAASSPTGAQLFYRQAAGGAWNQFDSNAIPSLRIEASGFVEIYARSGFARSPIIGGTYTIGSIPSQPIGGTDLNEAGISRAWLEYFNNPLSHEDLDKDNSTTAEEYAAGTDPRNPESYPPGPNDNGKPHLRITAMDPSPDYTLHFRLTGRPGIRHAVQINTTLAIIGWTDYISEFTMPVSGYYDFTAPYIPTQNHFFRGVVR